MSALPLKADMFCVDINFRYVPGACIDECVCKLRISENLPERPKLTLPAFQAEAGVGIR